MNLGLVFDQSNASYMPAMRHCFRYFNQVFSTSKKYSTWTEFKMWAKAHKITHVAVTYVPAKLLNIPLQGTYNDNIGYCWEKEGISFIIIPQLKTLYTVNHMHFLMEEYIRKLAQPHAFVHKDVFTWKHITYEEHEQWLELYKKAILIAVDIETGKAEHLIITSVSYTALLPGGRTKTCVISPDYNNPMPFIYMMRAFNKLPAPKIMQNGQYDMSYFMRFGAPLYNYLFDTYNMMHAMYSELPRDLAFMSGMFLANFKFWKEERLTGSLYEYNAKDTHNTLWLFIAQAHHANKYCRYAYRNYCISFPMVFPSISVGLEGIKVDEHNRAALRAKEVAKGEAALKKLQKWIGEEWNPGSPEQTLKLMRGVGYTQATSSDAKTLQAFAESHPLCLLLKDKIVEYRKATKAVSTYYDMTLLGGRLLYQQDPSGTDTGRAASKKSNYWVGTQIQNIPGYAKMMFMADEGYHLAEVDKSQSESRCTAYISQDENLMETVETSPDFHCTNASLFFGIPFNELYSIEGLMDKLGKKYHVLRKDIRKVAKRINHGANYNMGPQVLWDTMGTKEVFEAARLLGLPKTYTPLMICAYLLACFDKAYPRIKKVWYKEVIREIQNTGKLVGVTGWTRRTFLKPWESKLDLNSAVAHHPQSLSVMLVNQGWMDVWKKQFLEDWPIRIKAQIHDSLFFQYKIGSEWVVKEVDEIMYGKVAVIHGRTMRIPNDAKYGATYWGELKDD